MRTETLYQGSKRGTQPARRGTLGKPLHLPVRVSDVPEALLGIDKAAPPVTYLADGGIWSRVPASNGLRVTSLCGDLWLTQAGGADDVIVREGQSFTTTSRGKVVVQAMGAASFTFDDHA